MTLAQVGSAAESLSKRVADGLGLNDTLGDTAIFALQASLCSVGTLWLAMWLQLDSPYWAASTVLITAQATRPQSLLKAVNRVLGTMIGIVASLVIIALFPQHWWSFALALSGWIAFCTFVSCLFRALQSYAAALSGYTAVIVLTESFGDPNAAFATALSRGSTVVLGVTMYSLTALLLIPARSNDALRDSFEDMFTRVRTVAADVLRGRAGAQQCAALMARFPDFDQQIEEAATDGLWPPGAKDGMRRATLAMADMLVLSCDAAQGEPPGDASARARAASSRSGQPATMRATTGSGSRRIRRTARSPATRARASICSPTVAESPGMERLRRWPSGAVSRPAACTRKPTAERGLACQWRTVSATGSTASWPASGSRRMPEKKPEAARLGRPGRMQMVGRRRPMPSRKPRRE